MTAHEPMKIQIINGPGIRTLMVDGPGYSGTYPLDPDLPPVESLRQTISQLDRELSRKTRTRERLAAALEHFDLEKTK